MSECFLSFFSCSSTGSSRSHILCRPSLGPQCIRVLSSRECGSACLCTATTAFAVAQAIAFSLGSQCVVGLQYRFCWIIVRPLCGCRVESAASRCVVSFLAAPARFFERRSAGLVGMRVFHPILSRLPRCITRARRQLGRGTLGRPSTASSSRASSPAGRTISPRARPECSCRLAPAYGGATTAGRGLLGCRALPFSKYQGDRDMHLVLVSILLCEFCQSGILFRLDVGLRQAVQAFARVT